MIDAGSDIEFEGSSPSRRGDLVMNAGDDIRVNAGVENDYDYRKSSATGWIRKNKNETILSQGNSVASQVQTDGNLIMDAGADIEVVGSQLEARKGASLKADEDVLIAANETHYDYSHKSKSTGFLSGRKKSNTEKRQDVHQTYIKVGRRNMRLEKERRLKKINPETLSLKLEKPYLLRALKRILSPLCK